MYENYDRRHLDELETGNKTWIHYFEPLKKAENKAWVPKGWDAPQITRRCRSQKYFTHYLLQGHGAAEGRKGHHGGIGLLQRLCSFGTEQYYRDCALSELNTTETVLFRNWTLQRLCSFGTEHYRGCATAELNTTETVLLRNWTLQRLCYCGTEKYNKSSPPTPGGMRGIKRLRGNAPCTRIKAGTRVSLQRKTFKLCHTLPTTRILHRVISVLFPHFRTSLSAGDKFKPLSSDWTAPQKRTVNMHLNNGYKVCRCSIDITVMVDWA